MATQTIANVGEEQMLAESFKRLEPELAALTADEIVPINLEITSAVTTILGVVRDLKAYREGILSRLPDFDIARFDQLEDYARTLSYTTTKLAIASGEPDDLKALYEDALTRREQLKADVHALVVRGLIATASVDDLKGLNGYKNVATDLQILSMVLQENWAKVEGKCGATTEEVEHAAKLAIHLLRMVGERERSEPGAATAADLRARSYTLFLRAYDDVRRAIIYLRWHEGDADSIAPSLFAGRGGSKRKGAEEETGTVVAPPVATAPATAPAPQGLPGGVVIPTGPPAVPGATPVTAPPKPAGDHGPFV